jgi:hypothetical protein
VLSLDNHKAIESNLVQRVQVENIIKGLFKNDIVTKWIDHRRVEWIGIWCSWFRAFLVAYTLYLVAERNGGQK